MKKYDYDPNFEKVWNIYHTLNNAKKRYSEKQYLKKQEELCDLETTPESLADHIIFKLQEEIKYRSLQKAAGEHVRPWPHLSTYINQDQFDNEFVSTPRSELQGRITSTLFQCKDCGSTEDLSRLDEVDFACATCRWERYSGETRHMLRKGLEKAYAQLPKGKDESHYDYFNRYREFIKKQVFTRLPYNPAMRYESEVTGVDQDTVARIENSLTETDIITQLAREAAGER